MRLSRGPGIKFFTISLDTVTKSNVYSYYIIWSDGRVVERGGLENRYTLTGIGGSNPSRSVLRASKAS